MPTLSPAELQAARRRSGRLGGRPPKPTQSEAGAAALEDLLPAAVKSLRAHLGDGDPTAWRAALQVFAHAFGRAPEQVAESPTFPETSDEVRRLSWVQMQILAARLVEEPPVTAATETTVSAFATDS